MTILKLVLNQTHQVPILSIDCHFALVFHFDFQERLSGVGVRVDRDVDREGPLVVVHLETKLELLQNFFLLVSFLIIEQHIKKCKQLNTNIYSYLETSGGQSYNLYLNAVHFFNTSLN
jgi:hypothetical protein